MKKYGILLWGLLGLGIFALVAFYVPDDSLFKLFFGVMCFIGLIGFSLWFTGIWAALVNFFKRLFGK